MTTLRKPVPHDARPVVNDADSDQQALPSLVQSNSASSLPEYLSRPSNEGDYGQHAYCGGVLESYYSDDSDLGEVQLSPTRSKASDAGDVLVSLTPDNAVQVAGDSKHDFTVTLDAAPAVLLAEDAIAAPTESFSASKAGTKFESAMQDTSHFLGGLIKHPSETVKHYTILRHSHGLVYYRGPNTSLALSIFSDVPLSTDRQLWLQLKGWTGNTGMKAKALLGVTDSWINVTPEKQVDATELPPLDERAWQRDIKKFKAKAKKVQKTHILRETIIVRIPYEAHDGYFRMVLTDADSKRVLCPSPVFRVASTSMDASSLRGASLKTLPFELGVKFAQKTAMTMTLGAVAPVAITVKDQVASATSVMQYSGHAETAWNTLGAQGRIDAVSDQYAARQTAAIEADPGAAIQSTGKRMGNVIGDEAGPGSPFPVTLEGLIAKGTGSTTTKFSMPTCNLDDLAPDLLAQFPLGVYFGWALVQVKDKADAPLHQAWRHAIISTTYASITTLQAAQRKVVRAHIVHEYPKETSFVGSRLKLVLMGYLRPPLLASESDLMLLEMNNDIAITHASLSRPAWGYEEILVRMKTQKGERSITDRMVDLRVAGQRQIDRVPMHKLGMRMDSYGMHDRGMHGNGGFWVKRD